MDRQAETDDPARSVDYDQACVNYDFSRKAGSSNVQLLAELLHPLENSVVMDVGCGTGNYLMNLRGLAQRAVGLDASAGMLSQAKTKTGDPALISGISEFPGQTRMALS